MGRISGARGVQGWVKVHSYTEPRENILRFDTWILERDGDSRSAIVESGRSDGRTVAAKLGGVDDRDAARSLIGAQILVERSALPACEPGEHYWTDLEGLEVVTLDGHRLGNVDYMLATGANDVMVIAGERERLVPFASGSTVRDVDLETGRITVDWDPDF